TKLDRTVNSFHSFLTGLQKNEKLQLDRLLLAQCFTSIGKYAEAIEQLKKIPAPGANEDPKIQAHYKVVQVLLIRAYRLQGKDTKDPKSLKEARDLLDKIMAPTPEDMAKKPPQPGWGKRDINALKEEILLLMDMDSYGASVNRCNTLLGTLGKQMM